MQTLCLEPIRRLTPQMVRTALLAVLTLTIAFFPLGRAVQTLGPVLGGGLLCLLYAKDWSGSALARLPVKWLFAPFFIALFVQLAFSQWPALSWATVSPNLYRGYLLIFMALEAVSSARDLRWLVGAFALSALYMGLDGVWQYVTGFSFIRGEPIHMVGTPYARLTGSFSGPRTGDLMALMLLPACAVWYLLPARLGFWRTLPFAAIMGPGLFLCLGAQARSGYLALFFGLYILLFFVLNRPRWLLALLPLAGFALLVLFGPDRVNVSTAASDGRLAIWSAAWKTFLASPWTGHGAGTFTPAHTLTQGYMFLENGGDVQHPHNAYLQWLTEGGAVTFTLFALFFGGMLCWTFWRVYRGAQAERRAHASDTTWRLTAFFWAGFLGYLLINLAGHSFYRTWLVSMGMVQLGAVLGVCACKPRQGEPAGPTDLADPTDLAGPDKPEA